MDRQQVYRGQIPYETDVLEMQQFAYQALGLFSLDILGSGTAVAGLACTPTSPLSLNVNVGPGRIYSLTALDSAPLGQYLGTGGLPADTSSDHAILKQGLYQNTTAFAITPPGGAGQSQVYLIQATFQEVDDATTAASFYNSAAPATPTVANVSPARRNKCVVSLKAGIAATTGSQVTPTPDAGYVGLWDITVANGASSIASGNIAQHAGAPFISPLGSGTSPSFTGLVTIGGALDLTGVISPPQITATQNNYNPSGYGNATILRLTSDASRTITGLAAPAAEGGVKILRNVGSNDIVLSDQDSGSTSANRFLFGVNRTISPNRSILLIYDQVSGFWRDTSPMRKATTAEVLGGANDEAFVTAAGLKNAMAAQTLTDAATVAWDLSQGFRAKVTLGGNRTLGQPTNLQEGATGSLQVFQDGTGGRTLAYAACWDFRSAGTPALSTAAGKKDIIRYEVTDAVTPVIAAYFDKSA